MAYKKVLVEVEVPEKFKLCEKDFEENHYCPFSVESYDEESYHIASCNYTLKDCPMRNLKPVD